MAPPFTFCIDIFFINCLYRKRYRDKIDIRASLVIFSIDLELLMKSNPSFFLYITMDDNEH